MEHAMRWLGDRADGLRDALAVEVVGGYEEQRTEVRAVLSQVTELPLEVTEIAAIADDAGRDSMPDIAMVVFGGDEAAALRYLQMQFQRSPRPQLIALLPHRSPSSMRRALHAGADDLLFFPVAVDDVTRALLKLSETRRKLEQGGLAPVYSVTSLVGGVGVTTLSANIALALHYGFKKSVAVIDLDLQNSGLSVLLHLEPQQTIASLGEYGKKLDSIKLEAALTKHPSGIYLMAAPKRIEDSEKVSDITASAVLDLSRQLFDFVVVDSGRHIDENTVAAWERSDEVLYVLDQSLAAAHSVPRFTELFQRLEIRGAEPRVVLNKFDPQSEIDEEQIVQTSGVSIYAKIPRDDRVLSKVEMQAQDLWRIAPRSSLANAVENLARRLNTQRDAAAGTPGGFMLRLFSTVRARL
jgi:pilus assembly protein CpaE